ncbi:MAG: GntR family transcriptional regulator, partial [Candidatus Omnitrophica bacterium]|nr:GntR family transcriptional regulator [Candidatus Omnitrophota bacterium]
MKKIIEYQPKYKQIKEILKERIIKGKYAEGTKMPSENQLVKEFGVSKHTILKALTELINENYIYRIQGKGTFVCESKKRKKNKIAIIVYHSENIYFSKIIRGAEDYAKSNNYHLILCNSVGDYEKETSYINSLINEVDGFLISCVYLENKISSGLSFLIKNKFPFVFISHIPEIKNIKKFDFVIPDNFGGFYNLTKHLIINGYKNFIFLSIKNGFKRTEIKQRYEAFKKALKESKIKEDNWIVIETTDNDAMSGYIGDGYAICDELIKHINKEKLCIMCVGDGLAIGVLN